ncbi:YafY family transcriptional regulator [Ruminococcaceae bacterium OttesenSCG-928-O06]|nr:YafY family transcriptional regulator [Ruminococcaceae bacterium OttesenSCG-928-O06]
MHQRLFEITLLLTQHGSTTAQHLAGRFGVSTRTIYRDIDALSGAGVPVYTQRGKGGGIYLLPDYVLDKALFTKQEQQQLVAHFESLAALQTPDTAPVLDKLAALFGRGANWLQVDFAPWGGGEETQQRFRLLRDAILQRQEVAFAYAGATGDTQRQVHPARVVFRGQGWYLYGYCLLREDYRFFKLTRMRDVRLTGQGFAPLPAPPPTAPNAPAPMAHVRLKLDATLAFRALDEFLPEQLCPDGNGGCIAEFDFPMADAWLFGYVLSLGPGAEVLAPADLRRQLAAHHKAMAALYAADTAGDEDGAAPPAEEAPKEMG